ncbi:hypothetical protein GOL30_18665 [Sinorhizobium medicae]|uniref:hypothetical protein n=1 Tax=Sinorhizobium medicae TaxID=110321 RepID=UPI0004045734|nr:hypothetical protein [Sinorhizobium medicae]MDX0431142.1 hypothetical protein [Sinorhizobium medicae]MDX0442319.1 hypothetical protein [Sinorhizobium medicae]MDX0463839.1 hypothetical protein [Sinorhizobium medicae]MDX0537648.1 hypothetical protein [Sinorhizobium medicae]MDX0572419.1 hypothetical protein [Sinorhizobium medicae]
MKLAAFQQMLAAIWDTGMSSAEVAERVGISISALRYAQRKGPNAELAEAVAAIYRERMPPEPEPVRVVPRFHERCVPRWGR